MKLLLGFLIRFGTNQVVQLQKLIMRLWYSHLQKAGFHNWQLILPLHVAKSCQILSLLHLLGEELSKNVC